ncbi:reverse transcriptase [Tanacetum coccineum]
MPPRRRNRVNNEAYPAFTAAIAQAIADLLPTLTARITDEICQNENNRNNVNQRNGRRGPGNDGDAQPNDIHVWLERFLKEKPQTFSSASTPVEAENRIAHIEKIFEVLGCDDQFKARILNTEFTDVAQVANAARNIEIFRDRSKNEGNNKRDKDGHRIRPSDTPSQGSNQRAYDRRDSDRYGNVYIEVTDRVLVLRGRGVTKIRKAGLRATGACFECGEVWHLAKDCKKDNLKREFTSIVSENWSCLSLKETQVDASWKNLTHTLSGLFCASINFLESSTTYAAPDWSFRPVSGNLRYRLHCLEILSVLRTLLPIKVAFHSMTKQDFSSSLMTTVNCTELNLDRLLAKMWEAMGLVKDRGGCSIDDFCNQIHRSLV